MKTAVAVAELLGLLLILAVLALVAALVDATAWIRRRIAR